MKKHCTKCGETKPLSEFYKNASRKDGYDCHCKECQKKRIKKWQDANPEKMREYSRRHAAKNRAKNNNS